MTLIEEEHGEQDWTVRGLRLPPRLISLLQTGRWCDPDESALRSLMPWFEDPLIFLTSVDWMRRESRSLDVLADDEPSSHLFRQRRGSREPRSVDLPWLDVERAVLIAVNLNPGDDVAVALGYRTDSADPRVVASDFGLIPDNVLGGSWRPRLPSSSRCSPSDGGHVEPAESGRLRTRGSRQKRISTWCSAWHRGSCGGGRSLGLGEACRQQRRRGGSRPC